MNHKRPILVAALTAPVLLAFALPAETIAFHPKAGLTLKKTFESTETTTVDEMEVLMNGEENPMMPDMETEASSSSTIVVVDQYLACADGRPVRLLRTFETIDHESETDISMEIMGESQDINMEGKGTSQLEGTTVAFTMEEGEYRKSFHESEGDDALLEGLTEDMDLRVFLPDGDVSKGDSWEVDVTLLKAFLFPGGDLSLDIENVGGDSPLPGLDPSSEPQTHEIWGDTEGDVTATFSGTRDADGVTVAVIDIEVDISTARDISDFMRERMGDLVPDGVEMDISSIDMEVTIESTGQLLWNIAGGHMHSLEMSGTSTTTSDSAMEMNMGGQSMSIEQSTKASGTFTTKITVEVE
jgi:hypothetical protein